MSFIKHVCMLSRSDMVVIKTMFPVRAANSWKALNICLQQLDVDGVQGQDPRGKHGNIYRVGV